MANETMEGYEYIEYRDEESDINDKQLTTVNSGKASNLYLAIQS